ncbi:hypothetical protein [Alkalihalobacterium chitinilyticum]|uniref:Uncharacterized protein n=1 Tax=Alkalihalobacterium chitinilyticum TaxID=2980103 RepID=A0ABT5VKI5_9BACI|nr:hypothetical protein [Alkalihalobacterium chitinilyticum]MDE5415726.1 hypothetical protein [Alkalihalobacterium chitinilyticum]
MAHFLCDRTTGKWLNIKLSNTRDDFTYLLIEKEKLEREARKIKVGFENKYDSLQALAGALLQIAKQGISTTYQHEDSPLTRCKGGKKIKSQYLKNVIWEGRNQSMHYEEGFTDDFKKTKECFVKLKEDYNLNFDIDKNYKKNLAKEVVLVLGWKTYEDYRKSMLSLV